MSDSSIFLVVHQSADMYGSDLSLLDALRAAPEGVRPVVVPVEGPLTGEFRRLGIETHIGPVCKISSAIGTVGGVLNLAKTGMKSQTFLRAVVGARNLAFVYTNTVAVLSGAVFASRRRAMHAWHVREIVQSPAVAAWALPKVVRRLGDRVICNSHATLQWIEGGGPASSRKLSVVWNGVDAASASPGYDRNALRATLGCGADDVLVMLVGRINRWKGQEILLRAFELLAMRGERRAKAVIVGSPPAGQEHLLESLMQQLRASTARDRVRVEGYCQNVWDLWRAADIAVVPSTQPEPFGRVAIEAMAVGLPVVAANHGGLAEIVVDGQTGILVPPGDAESLATAIRTLTDESGLRIRLGEAGRRRHRAEFGVDAYIERMRAEFARMVPGPASREKRV